MPNLYFTLTDWKSRGNLSQTTDDAALLAILEAASRQVDDWCRRHFYSLTATRYLDGSGKRRLLLPFDLVAVTTLKEDEDYDGTYGLTWASADYVLTPYDADPTGNHEQARPYWAIEASRRSDSEQSYFRCGQRLYQLVGKFGYWERTELLSSTVGETFSSSDTTLTVSSGTPHKVGETLLIESEQLYVSAKSGNDLTAQRGVNGTTAAAHANGTAIRRHIYPSGVQEAVYIQASHLWKLRAAGASNRLGFEETGQVALGRGMAQEALDFLRPYELRMVA